jgi:outer membrane receptor protein involved in Fe transport
MSAAIAPTRSLKLVTAYTYVNAIERTPIVGDVLRTFVVPRNQVSFVVTEQPTSRLMFTLDTLQSGSYLEPVYGDTGTQTYRFGGLHKVNAGASYRIPLKEFQAIRFFVHANNIFNQTYFEAGFPTPGRVGLGGLQFEF